MKKNTKERRSQSLIGNVIRNYEKAKYGTSTLVSQSLIGNVIRTMLMSYMIN